LSPSDNVAGVNLSAFISRVRDAFGWGLVALPIWAAASILVGVALGWLSRRLLARLTRRTANQWDDEIVARLTGPMAIGWAVLVAYVCLAWLHLSPAAELAASRTLRAAFIVTVFWMLLRGVDVADRLVGQSAWATGRLASQSFVALGSKVVKIAVVIIGVVTLLSQAGYPVGSIIAGLGIGGLALALAAQKTVENVFGAFSIAVDEPFRQGDFVKIDGVLGTIEAIGLRSTRIRTLDRTLVAIPNGKLAEMRTETFAARDRLRLACTLALVYGTTAEQMRRVLAGVEQVLRAHPKLWPDGLTVCLKELADSSLNVDVMAWFNTKDWSEFQLIRQEILLGFMDAVESAGSGFAFPTRTVRVVNEDAVQTKGPLSSVQPAK
jgi:MscS family membrane protein